MMGLVMMVIKYFDRETPINAPIAKEISELIIRFRNSVRCSKNVIAPPGSSSTTATAPGADTTGPAAASIIGPDEASGRLLGVMSGVVMLVALRGASRAICLRRSRAVMIVNDGMYRMRVGGRCRQTPHSVRIAPRNSLRHGRHHPRLRSARIDSLGRLRVRPGGRRQRRGLLLYGCGRCSGSIRRLLALGEHSLPLQ